jgi:hypothetical protein
VVVLVEDSLGPATADWDHNDLILDISERAVGPWSVRREVRVRALATARTVSLRLRARGEGLLSAELEQCWSRLGETQCDVERAESMGQLEVVLLDDARDARLAEDGAEEWKIERVAVTLHRGSAPRGPADAEMLVVAYPYLDGPRELVAPQEGGVHEWAMVDGNTEGALLPLWLEIPATVDLSRLREGVAAWRAVPELVAHHPVLSALAPPAERGRDTRSALPASEPAGGPGPRPHGREGTR